MFQEVVTGTNIIFYLMVMVAAVGVISKIVNQITLRSLVKAAGNMPKSTHKLMKLVRSKYEHACMLHDRVENVDAFVEKYIYEYRGILFRIHTWRQMQIQAIWFSGLLAILGASAWYMKAGMCEAVFQYIAAGAAQMILLFVISQLSDEQHKIMRIRIYMVDYLDNVCAFRYRKIRQVEREQIDVIQAENMQARAVQNEAVKASAVDGQAVRQPRFEEVPGRDSQIEETREKTHKKESKDLSIHIEGEGRRAQKGDLAKRVFGKQDKERDTEEVQSSVQEETIRRILEEFLA
ncbi:MAG: hypothetical protein J5983_04825 [Ruminococcus sp.]|nr:hypothetical protein [Ruminococcus sp.]